MARHRPHCDGTVAVHTSDDGNRVYASPAPDRVEQLG